MQQFSWPENEMEMENGQAMKKFVYTNVLIQLKLCSEISDKASRILLQIYEALNKSFVEKLSRIEKPGEALLLFFYAGIFYHTK